MRIAQLRPERLRYHGGQLLSALDLQDDFQVETQLRWWHTVGLHNTWGIAWGLDVSVVGRRIRITPGMAYDYRGRELILAEATEINLPDEGRLNPQPIHWMLVASYDTASAYTPGVEIGVVCLDEHADSNPEHLIFSWRNPDKVQMGTEVPLLLVSMSSISMGIDIRPRRYAQPMMRPHIFAGRTPPNTPWQPWTIFDDSDQHLGWSIEVDTSEAGFLTVPHYFASLSSDGFEFEPDLARRLIGPFTFIAQPKTESFTFVVLFATTVGNIEPDELDRIFQASVAAVDWMGIEPEIACGPIFGTASSRQVTSGQA